MFIVSPICECPSTSITTRGETPCTAFACDQVAFVIDKKAVGPAGIDMKQRELTAKGPFENSIGGNVREENVSVGIGDEDGRLAARQPHSQALDDREAGLEEPVTDLAELSCVELYAHWPRALVGAESRRNLSNGRTLFR